MKTLHLVQGSPEWRAHRATARNASDAPAMMGASPYVSRAQLVRRRATGVEPEIDAATQKRFDDGHRVEPALRALAESIIGEDLYPVIGVSDDGYLSASFDGVTLGEDVILEAKQHNASKAACMARGEIPTADYWQIVQQFAVCESAQRCIYLVGDGGPDTARLWIDRDQVASDIQNLRDAWAQFDADVAAYVQETDAAPSPIGRAPETLPALSIQVTGMVTASNLAEFKSNAMAVLNSINRDLQTDEDFANAEKTVGWCKGVEERIEATKQQVLGQTADIDAVFRTMDDVSAETRRIRLELDKLVAKRKEERRAEIGNNARRAVQDHVRAINETLGEHALAMPATLIADLQAAIKGKRSFASMQDAVDAVAANAKIAASQAADRIRVNVAILAEHQTHAHLFADRVALCASKAPDDLRNLVAARVAEFERAEEQRREQERERIRQEESDRLQREQQAAEADRLERERAQVAQVKQPESAGKAEVAVAPARTGAGTATQDTAAYAAAVGAIVSTLPAQQQPVAAASSLAIAPDVRIKLGDINAAIAPLSITAEGLASIGFKPVGQDRAAKLYAAADFDAIRQALIAGLRDAQLPTLERAA